MLNRRIFHPPFRLGRKLGMVIMTAMAVSQVHAHDSPLHSIPETPSQDIIVNQQTVGVSSKLRYGPVRSGETLSSIARQHTPTNMSRKKYMNMILQLNPQAFINNNKNKLKAKSVLILPNYQDTIGVPSIAKQRTQFNDQKIQLLEYNASLQLKSTAAAAPFFPQVPIRVIVPNTLSQQQKQAKLQAQIQQTQQTVIHEQVSLLQQINLLEQQLSVSQESVAELNHNQQQLALRNQNLLLQLQDLHVKYEHIIKNYTFSPKF
ncbi:MAG: Tfp pilus assembly protein FimV [Moritella dasanensis]|jgi:Tfp pilus assembly protein FimV